MDDDGFFTGLAINCDGTTDDARILVVRSDSVGKMDSRKCHVRLRV